VIAGIIQEKPTLFGVGFSAFAATLARTMFPATWSKRLIVLWLLCVALRLTAQQPTPGYNSRWRTADGTEKLALAFGGGYDITAGGARHNQTRGWDYMMQGGYNFNHLIGVSAEYSFDHFVIPEAVGPGSVHLWSATLQPTFHYFRTEHFGGYVLGGGGFYRKLTSLNEGELSNNAGGADVGTGIAWRVSDNSNAKFFAEARYVWVDNQPSPQNTYYAPANERTAFFPVVGGIRW
jgi:hypothetical protein